MSEWMGRGTQSTPCVCGVSSAICVCVWEGGFGGRREERGDKRGQRGRWVWWPGAKHSATPACVPPQCAAVPSPTTNTHTHSGQGGAAHTVVVVGGNGAQWWWQPHHTQPPPPRASHALCVCDGSGQHQHSQ